MLQYVSVPTCKLPSISRSTHKTNFSYQTFQSCGLLIQYNAKQPSFALLLHEALNTTSFVVFQGINAHKCLNSGWIWCSILCQYWHLNSKRREQGSPISSEIYNTNNLHLFELLSEKSLQTLQCAFNIEQENLSSWDLHPFQKNSKPFSGREQKGRGLPKFL